MSALSPTMKNGQIVSWAVKEGDKVVTGDLLAEIQTDKAKVPLEATESKLFFNLDGYVAKILQKEGAELEVGVVIALIVSKKEDISKATLESEPIQVKEEIKKEEKIETKSETKKKESINFEHTKIKMSALSPTMKDGQIVRWAVKEGDKVVIGDLLAEIQTDKAVVGLETTEAGYVGKILANAGETSEVGKVIAIIVEKKENIEKCSGLDFSETQEVKKEQNTNTNSSVNESKKEIKETKREGDRIFVSPLAKSIANQNGVSLENITGSGPNSRIIKNDVEDYMKNKKEVVIKTETKKTENKVEKETSSSSTEFKDIPNSQIRKIIADRLLESKQTIPHYYLTVECEIDSLMKLRQKLNELGEKKGYKLSVNDFIIKAAGKALKKVPQLNSSWQESFIREYKNADISIAVQTDSGLITPIVFDVNGKGLEEISQTVKVLAEKAKNQKLQLNEFVGGTFTISNLGMFGVTEFSAIINPPQAAILAVGTGEKKVKAEGEGFKSVTVMKVTLSCDHRVVDGAVGAKWLQSFKENIEEPLLLIL
jgi:pyruvate dehydrogenase E2 component (dihydrolipoamide acetyltransferase)